MCVLLDAPELPGLSGEAALTVLEIRESDGAGVPVPEGRVLLILPPIPPEEEDGEATPDTLPEAVSPDAEMLETYADILRRYSVNIINSLK